MGAGGVIPPPEGYLTKLAEICRRHGILLIFDEVITGFGRTGEWFAAQRWDVTPDLMVLAKGLSSAYAPIGAVAATDAVHEAFVDTTGAVELPHGYTYSGHPVSCAAALANLEIMEEEGLPKRVAAMEGQFQATVATLADNPDVVEVRGVGFLAGIELRGGPDAAAAAAKRAWEGGVILRPLGATLALSPPLIITEDEIAQGVDVIRDAIR
jgi:beta-alanine--pyruvate transaminase